MKLPEEEQARRADGEAADSARGAAGPGHAFRRAREGCRRSESATRRHHARCADSSATSSASSPRIARRLLRHGAHSVAVAVLDNATGEWLAWEGSGDYFGEDFGGAIDGVVTLRQPGSTLKPFTYALAFESGHSPATVLADVPSHFPTAEEGSGLHAAQLRRPHRGPLRVRAALAGSQNVPAVAMLHRSSVAESFLRLLRNSGFTDLNRTADYLRPRPDAGRRRGDARAARHARTRRSRAAARLCSPTQLHRQPAAGKPATALANGPRSGSPTSSATPSAREYAFGAGGSLDFPFPVAVKTGTSQAYRDNWTVGYTRDVTVGVWVGNFDRRPLRGSSGITGAAPIFHSVMLAAMKRARGTLPIGEHDADRRAAGRTSKQMEICALSGAAAFDLCSPRRAVEWLTNESGALLLLAPRRHASTGPPNTARGPRRTQPVRRVPRRTTLPSVPHRQPSRRRDVPDRSHLARRNTRPLRLRADASSRVVWRVNDRPIAATEWSLVPGRHTITAIDASGRRKTRCGFW